MDLGKKFMFLTCLCVKYTWYVIDTFQSRTKSFYLLILYFVYVGELCHCTGWK